MSEHENAGIQHSAKRMRTATACQHCRIKKLSCSGSRPCTRCSQDRRECVDADLSERTPLTRKRMTELEQRIDDYERVWNLLCPHHPLEDLHAKLSSAGPDAVIETIKATSNVFQHSHTVVNEQSLVSPHSSSALSGHEPFASPLSSRHTSDYPPRSTPYPPTRPASPRATTVRFPLNLHESSNHGSNAWSERSTPADAPTDTTIPHHELPGELPGDDSGIGVRAGAGYIGMSSGLTLLRAIQKFASADARSLDENVNPNDSSMHTKNVVRSHRLSRLPIPGSESHEELVLPPPDEIMPLVDTYFLYFHTLTPILHEPTIRAQIMGAMPLPTDRGSRVLFNMIFATGAFDSALQSDTDSNGEQYYEKARSALQEDLLLGGSLTLVQGLTIMAIWLQRISRPNAGYICLGLAMRMAITLGIHVSAPNNMTSGLSILESEMRARTWWGIVTLETGHCMTYGRPHGFNLPSLSTARFPINTDDGLLTVSTSHTPSEVDRVTLYTALINQAWLAQMASHSLDRLSRSLPSPTAEQIKWCGDQFREQLAALPHYMQPGAAGPYIFARAVQTWRARDYQSILYRPVLLSAAWNTSGLAVSDENVKQVIETCRELALDNLQDISDFDHNSRDRHRGCEWYMVYFAIQASLTLLFSLVWEPHHPASVYWRKRIEETVLWLRQLGPMRELGASYAQIMERVLEAKDIRGIQSPMNPPIHHHNQSEQQIDDLDRFDFGRYLSEIWDGQEQTAGIAYDGDLGILPTWWVDSAPGVGSQHHT